MARKRGGLAGIWDRNKKFIKPIATIGAGVLTGGMGGALVGGLMNGLDREGKGGIGFDVGKGAMGAAQGYGMGKLGAGLKAGIMNRLGAGAAGKGANLLAAGTEPMNRGLSMIPEVGADAMPAMAMPAAASAAPGMAAGGIANAAANGPWYKDGKLLASAGNAMVGGMNAYTNAQQARAMRQQQERENRIQDDALARRRALDPARAALLAQIFSRLGMGATPV